MAGIQLTDCKIYLGGYNLSGFHNSLNLEYGAEMLDDTVFGTTGTRSNKPGIKTVNFNGNIFWDTLQDEANYNRIGAAREVLSVAPVGNATGDTAYAVRAVNGTYNPISGAVGELLSAEFDALSANSPLVRGVVIALGDKTTTGNGTSVQLGALSATQRVYSAIHAVTITGTGATCTPAIESDDTQGMGTPTTRITHANFTLAGGIGAQWGEAAGPITDTWWRAKWTIAGTNPHFVLYWVLAIL